MPLTWIILTIGILIYETIVRVEMAIPFKYYLESVGYSKTDKI